MAKILYVAYVCGGEYDDAYKKPLFGSFNKNEIERRRINDLLQGHSSQWREEIKAPEYPRQELKDRPSFAGLTEKQITPEMRQERKEINEYNEEIGKKHTVLVNAYHEQLNLAKEAYLNSLELSEEEKEYHRNYKCYMDYNKRYLVKELKVV